MGYPFLHFTPIAPSIAGNGLAMRAGMFSEALAQAGGVDVVVIDGGSDGAVRWHPDRASVHCLAAGARPDTRLQLIRMMPDPPARNAALRSYGRPSTSAALSAPVLAEAAALYGPSERSAIAISRSYLLPMLGALGARAQSPPVIVDLDDDDAALCRETARLARERGEDARADWLEAEADAYDSLIRTFADRVAAFTCASDAAAASVRSRLNLAQVRTIPNGIATAGRQTSAPESDVLIFVGNLSYEPNVDGLLWFVSSVWPIVRSRLPDVRLVVAGSLPTEAVRQACTGPGISLHADPPDLAPLYRQASLAVVPLRLGNGSRIKILEAGAHGVPVVSTRKGAEGLDLRPDREALLSDSDAGDLAGACIAGLCDRTAARERATALQRFVKSRHERSDIVAAIADLVRSLI